MKDNLFDDIKKKLDNYEEPAMEGLWEDILSEVENTPTAIEDNTAHTPEVPAVKNPESGRKRWKTMFIPAAAAAVCIAASLLFTLRDKGETTSPVIAEKTETPLPDPVPQSPEPETKPSQPSITVIETPKSEDSKNLIAEYIPTAPEKAIPSTGSISGKEESIPENNPLPESTAAEQKESNTAKIPDPKTQREDNFRQELLPEEKEYFPYQDIPAEKPKKESRLAISLSASNLPGSSTSTTGYSQAAYVATPIPNTALQNSLWVDPMGNVTMRNNGKEINTETTYTPPVRAGLTLRYEFPCGIGIETGVQYVYLSSETTSGSEDNYYRTNEALHYVGIPLTLSYGIWTNRYISIYAAAGGAFEKAVYGNTRTTYYIDQEKTDESPLKSLDPRPVQWSVNAVAGFQFNILQDFGIYVEPGVGYYFDDGSKLQTIYKSKPWNFYLRFGLRYTFRLLK